MEPKPLLANRLVLAYYLAIAAALILAILLGAIYGALVGATLGAAGADPEAIAREVGARVDAFADELFQLAMALSLGGLILWIARRYLPQYKEAIGWTRPVPPAEALELTLWVLAYGLFFTLAAGWLVPAPYLEALVTPYQADGPLGGIALALAATIFAPLVEEWIFRGFLLRSYALAKGTRFALAANTLIFGLLHGEPVTALSALGIGYLLGRYLLARGRLKAAFFAHAANNGVSFLGVVFSIPYLNPATKTGPVLGILGLLGVVLTLLAFTRRFPVRHRPPERPGPVWSASLVVAIVVAALILVGSLLPDSGG